MLHASSTQHSRFDWVFNNNVPLALSCSSANLKSEHLLPIFWCTRTRQGTMSKDGAPAWWSWKRPPLQSESHHHIHLAQHHQLVEPIWTASPHLRRSSHVPNPQTKARKSWYPGQLVYQSPPWFSLCCQGRCQICFYRHGFWYKQWLGSFDPPRSRFLLDDFKKEKPDVLVLTVPCDQWSTMQNISNGMIDLEVNIKDAQGPRGKSSGTYLLNFKNKCRWLRSSQQHTPGNKATRKTQTHKTLNLSL